MPALSDEDRERLNKEQDEKDKVQMALALAEYDRSVHEARAQLAKEKQYYLLLCVWLVGVVTGGGLVGVYVLWFS